MTDKIPLIPPPPSPPSSRQGGAGGEVKSKPFWKRKTSSADAQSARSCDKQGKFGFFSRRSLRGSKVRQSRVGRLWWQGRNITYTKGDRSRFQTLREAFEVFIHFFAVLSEKFRFRTRAPAPAPAPEEVDNTPLTSVEVDRGWQKINDLTKSHRERVIGYTTLGLDGDVGARNRMQTYNKAYDCAGSILIRCRQEQKKTFSEKNMVDLRHWFKVMCTTMEQDPQRFLHDFEIPTL